MAETVKTLENKSLMCVIKHKLRREDLPPLIASKIKKYYHDKAIEFQKTYISYAKKIFLQKNRKN